MADAIDYVVEETKRVMKLEKKMTWILFVIARVFENIAHSSIINRLSDTGAKMACWNR